MKHYYCNFPLSDEGHMTNNNYETSLLQFPLFKIDLRLTGLEMMVIELRNATLRLVSVTPGGHDHYSNSLRTVTL